MTTGKPSRTSLVRSKQEQSVRIHNGMITDVHSCAIREKRNEQTAFLCPSQNHTSFQHLADCFLPDRGGKDMRACANRHSKWLLFINGLLTSTSSSIHSFADDTFLSSSFSFNPNDHASTDIQLHRNTSASLLSNDLTVIEKWGKDSLVSFNESKTKQAVISRKRNKKFPPVLMNGGELDTSMQLGLSLSSNLTWKTQIHSLAKHPSLAPAGFSHLITF